MASDHADAVEQVDEAELLLFEPDPVLLAAEGLAREALRDLTADSNVGALVGSASLGEHLVNLQFECRLLAYPHWLWTVTLSRIDDGAEPTVLEYELLPGPGALLSPAWVPWSERLAAAEESDGPDGPTAEGAVLDGVDIEDDDLDDDDDELDVDDLEDELDGVDDLDEEIDDLDDEDRDEPDDD